MVCDKNVLPETSQMVFNFGVMFGAIVFGFLSDKYGRKKSFITALLLQAFLGSLTAASPNFVIFTLLRFFVGALEQVCTVFAKNYKIHGIIKLNYNSQEKTKV